MTTDDVPRAPRRSPVTVAVTTVRAFLADRGTDVAAALTFYAVLAIAPAAAALLSVVGLLENPQSVVDEIKGVLREVASPEVVETVGGILDGLADNSSAGVAFVVGLLGALWSASAFVTAFSRAMNTVHGDDVRDFLAAGFTPDHYELLVDSISVARARRIRKH